MRRKESGSGVGDFPHSRGGKSRALRGAFLHWLLVHAASLCLEPVAALAKRVQIVNDLNADNRRGPLR